MAITSVQVWVPGPLFVFVAGGGAAVGTEYLGTSERGVSVTFNYAFKPVFNDLAGPIIPFDRLMAGRDATVSGKFNRFKEQTYRHIINPTPILDSQVNSDFGVDAFGSTGTLMVQEGFAYQLLLIFPYSLSSSMEGQPKGIRFVAATIDGHALPNLGAGQERQLDLSWYCGRIFVDSLGKPAYDSSFAGNNIPTNPNSFVLFDYNVPTGLQTA